MELKPDLEYLAHYGVLGMKWGVRKDRRSGNLSRKKPKKNVVRISKDDEPIELDMKADKFGNKTYTMFTKEGKKVGLAFTDKVSSEEVNFNWFNVKPSEMGKGYAKSAMRLIVDDARKDGYKKMTAECVRTNEGRALHIAKSVGFVQVGSDNSDNVWGGYDFVELDLTKKQSLSHTEDYLAHYGVKGMKWGVRKDDRTGIDRRRSKAQDDASSKKGMLRNSYRIKHANGQELTPEEKKLFDEDAKKFAAVVGTGLLVGAGLIAVKTIGAKRASRALHGLSTVDKATADLTKNAKKAVDPTQRLQEWLQGYADRSADIFDAIPKEAVERMSTTALEIPAGQTIKRMSTNAEKKIRDAVYASFKEDDWNRYKAVLPIFWQTQQGKSEGYQITYKAAKTLRAPSEREQFKLFSEEFAKLRKENPAVFEDLMESYDMRAFWGGGGKMTTLKERAKAGMSDEELARRAYDAFAQDIVNPESLMSKRFVERVRKEGYNMIVDNNDRGRLSDMPVIILDGKDNLIREGMEKVGLMEIDAARRLLKDVTGARVPKK